MNLLEKLESCSISFLVYSKAPSKIDLSQPAIPDLITNPPNSILRRVSARAGFNPDKVIGKVVNHLAGIGHKIKDGFNYVVNYEAYLINNPQRLLVQEKATVRKAAKKSADFFDSQHDKNIYDSMKYEYPILAQYDALLNQHRHASGYYREKFDGKIQEIVKNILQEKKLMAQLNQMYPEMAHHITSQSKPSLKQGLEHER